MSIAHITQHQTTDLLVYICTISIRLKVLHMHSMVGATNFAQTYLPMRSLTFL